ncbi:Kef-type K+ transport system, predicted NAD-binding component [Methylacidimicrobium sp. AP8]|uniref:potassium channel family protein n=1 Tax=Methylacidimicrobium sp. AP8 TaxID=2730359 RepID=UPI0018C09618|nr:potassium channel protein [Methylacidimicrobium sp. AP8]CAB4244110.1 Kef-type K+ transport system, predicted NAD-binding component [Methylacidimicrobium sp. AP8]
MASSRTSASPGQPPLPPAVRHPFRHFLGALIVLLLLVAAGTFGYRRIEGMSLLDALYMTVITLSTVGFEEVHPLSPQGRLFTIGLIVGGGALAAYAAGRALNYLFSVEWRDFLAARRQTRMLKGMKDHYLVCGFGRVGRHVTQEMIEQRQRVVVIDSDPEALSHLRSREIPAIEGDASDEAVLRAAGISQAKGLVACASSDAENLLIVLTARLLCPGLPIVARALDEASEFKLKKAGADRVVLPYQLAAYRIITSLVRPAVADFLWEVAHVGGVELFLEQIPVRSGSCLVGQTLGQAQLRNRFHVTIVGCRMPDGTLAVRPTAETVLEAGQELIALGTHAELQAFARLASGQDPGPAA